MVDPTTRTVPILAETPNPDDMLKLGMFVRIVLDSATSDERSDRPGRRRWSRSRARRGSSSPPATENGRTFTFRPVKLGREAGDRQVIALRPRPKATRRLHGAFLLKSELILQNETEED